VPFGDGPAPIDLTSNISIPVMDNFGDTDENPSSADVKTIDDALTAAGVTHDFKSYPGAGHGFNCDDRGSYNEAAATDAFSRTLGFFDANVK
jgi:carboxymethylenebutenolidase